MKKLLLFLLIIPFSLSAQYAAFNWNDTAFKPFSQRDVKIHFSIDNNSTISEDNISLGTLDTIGRFLKEHPSLYIQIGCNISEQGPTIYNARLTTKQALNIANYLISQKGIDSTRIYPVGFGYSQPRVGMDAINALKTQQQKDSAMALNRRTIIMIVKTEPNFWDEIESRFSSHQDSIQILITYERNEWSPKRVVFCKDKSGQWQGWEEIINSHKHRSAYKLYSLQPKTNWQKAINHFYKLGMDTLPLENKANHIGVRDGSPNRITYRTPNFTREASSFHGLFYREPKHSVVFKMIKIPKRYFKRVKITRDVTHY